MSIFIRSLKDKTIVINCEPSDTFLSIKNKFYNKENITLPADAIRFIFRGKTIYDYNKTLQELDINNESTINTFIPMKGNCNVCGYQRKNVIFDSNHITI